MSGHSKWSTIKRKKGANDAKRGQMFTKLAKDITIAAREGGGDVNANPSLRTAVDKAKGMNMPKANIQRAIDRGTGNIDGMQIEEARYEGYASGGVAVIVECLTDNKNRTVSEIRNCFSKRGGSLGEAGSVAYIFEGDKPSFSVPLGEEDKSKFKNLIEDIESIDEVVSVNHNLQEEAI